MGRDTRRVVVVGGAITGSLVAWWLRREGFAGRVTVVEPDPTFERASTARSAASIRAQFATEVNVRMSLFGMAFLRDLDRHLGPGPDVAHVEGGYLILGSTDEDEVAGRREALAMQRAAGADVVALDPTELTERFPWMDVDGVGIGTLGRTGEGWFDAWLLLTRVRAALRDLAVTEVTDAVVGFRTTGDRLAGVELASGDALAADVVVLAAGAASGRLAGLLDIDLAVAPRKRTVVSFDAPLDGTGLPLLVDTSGAWVRPEGTGFIAGIPPLPEDDVDAHGDVTPHRGLLEERLWPALARRVPALQELRRTGAWAGHYAVHDLDHNAVVGPHDVHDNLVFAAGFSGHGLQHAPAVGRGIEELVTAGRFTTLDLSPLGWERVRDGRPLRETVVI